MNNPQKQEDFFPELEYTNESNLILHNDEVNSFDFVIDALIEICDHEELQAEQCALITHYNGKCDVKKGENTVLEKMKNNLLDRGLSVTIEN